MQFYIYDLVKILFTFFDFFLATQGKCMASFLNKMLWYGYVLNTPLHSLKIKTTWGSFETIFKAS